MRHSRSGIRHVDGQLGGAVDLRHPILMAAPAQRLREHSTVLLSFRDKGTVGLVPSSVLFTGDCGVNDAAARQLFLTYRPRGDTNMQEPVGTASLADQLRNGDSAAFSTLLDLYGSSMLRVARGYVSSREQAEDVVQETWIAVLRGIDRFEGRASLRTLIFTILINVAKKHGLA